MSKEFEQLREAIRNILEESNSLPEERMTENNGSTSQLDWYMFEEFGTRLLQNIGYKGDFNEILHNIKRNLETQDGWRFDN